MDSPDFGLFDQAAEVVISGGNLPHWFQPSVAVFVTLRTADSLPRDVLDRWDRELREWLRQAGVPADPTRPVPDIEHIPEPLRRNFRRHRNQRWHGHLDSCHGDCVLRRSDLAEVVSRSLQHFDGERYDIDSFVVMPNHVHMLVQFRSPTTCREQCASWMRFTARELNSRLGRRGEFWQGEPFDHLVRTAEQFEALRTYIADNGPRARLPASDSLSWSRAMRDSVRHGTSESPPTRT